MSTTRLAGLALALLATTGCTRFADPPFVPDADVVYLDQNWSDLERWNYYYTSQGTMLMPLAWFVALEQPDIKITAAPKFRDDEYLARFGFLPGPDEAPERDPARPDLEPAANPHKLPVGFATDTIDIKPGTGTMVEVVGFACATCHTGQLTYQGKGIRIDAGTAMIDVDGFQEALGLALVLTDKLPGRFNRFAREVLGENYTAQAKAQLKEELDAFLAAALAQKKEADARKLWDVKGGPGRTDALARIGNRVFGYPFDAENLRKADANVKFPHVWDASWFDWVQYNSSIQEPMARNIGEALGVNALVAFDPDGDPRILTTVNITGLHAVETLLAGEAQPFTGLRSPRWPEDIFGAIDRDQAAAGEALYKSLCQRCHLPPIDSELMTNAAGDFWSSDPPTSLDQPYASDPLLVLKTSNVWDIGTDPGQAVHFVGRTVNTGSLLQGLAKPPDPTKAGIIDAAYALEAATAYIRDTKFEQMGFANEEQKWIYGGRRQAAARAILVYKARPLNGIWAVPPYLHNGSVPNVYELLSPVEDRSTRFTAGNREYDPVLMGYKPADFANPFILDTTLPGNSNAGHEFKGDGRSFGNGVIGRTLTHDERMQIIEYLKTLGPAEGVTNWDLAKQAALEKFNATREALRAVDEAHKIGPGRYSGNGSSPDGDREGG